jgi:hypothetical protein
VIVLLLAALTVLAALVLALSLIALLVVQVVLPFTALWLLVVAPWWATQARRRRGRKVWP